MSDRLPEERVREIAGEELAGFSYSEFKALAREVLALREVKGVGVSAKAFQDALDAAWIDGYTTGADPAWCAKTLRRMGRGDVEESSQEAAALLLPDYAEHRPDPDGPTHTQDGE